MLGLRFVARCSTRQMTDKGSQEYVIMVNFVILIEAEVNAAPLWLLKEVDHRHHGLERWHLSTSNVREQSIDTVNKHSNWPT